MSEQMYEPQTTGIADRDFSRSGSVEGYATATEQVSPHRAVDLALSVATHNVNALEEALAELYQRLVPVLLPCPPSEPSSKIPGEGPGRQIGSQVTEHLYALASRSEVHRTLVVDILDRLEV